ncbi:hypothetical protein [Salipiger sp. PrR003]|uniref:hypothetical protein n=1 Tax=Salipiger sp. PrR003 TaxID=2706776 RepID=UPI0013DD4A9F|nr:hypothetical protein [Salipiger sp. PrR003]NDV50124.1 hypothetical protein [Salipiger sp. PrR003]
MTVAQATIPDRLKIREPLAHRINDELRLIGMVMHRLQLAHRAAYSGKGVDGKPVCAWLGFDFRLSFWGFGDDGNEQLWDANHKTFYVDTLFTPSGTHWTSITEAREDQNWKMTGSHWPCFQDGWEKEPRDVLWNAADNLLPRDYWDRASRTGAIDLSVGPTRMPAELVVAEIEDGKDERGCHTDIVKKLSPYDPETGGIFTGEYASLKTYVY